MLPRTEDGIRSCRFIPVYKHAADADRPADPSKPQHHPRGPVNVYLLDFRRDSVARLAYLVRHSIALANRGLPGEWGLYPACAVRRGDYVGAYLGRVLFINPKVRWGSLSGCRLEQLEQAVAAACRAGLQSKPAPTARRMHAGRAWAAAGRALWRLLDQRHPRRAGGAAPPGS